MKRAIYIILIISLLSAALTGCVSKDTIEELKEQEYNLYKIIDDSKNENAAIRDEIKEIEADLEDIRGYNEELKNQIEDMKTHTNKEFSFTFDEFYAQLIYLSLKNDIDIFNAPRKIIENTDGTITYAIITNIYDGGGTSLQVVVWADKHSGKVLECYAGILQYNEYRQESEWYSIGYEDVTNMVLSALIMADKYPYEDRTQMEVINKIRDNESFTCTEYNIGYTVYQDEEVEYRYFFPYTDSIQ